MENLANRVMIGPKAVGDRDMGSPCKMKGMDIVIFGITGTAKWKTKFNKKSE